MIISPFYLKSEFQCDFIYYYYLTSDDSGRLTLAKKKLSFLYIVLNSGFFFMVVSSIFKVSSKFFPLWEWFYLFSLILWFMMFPTFIEQGKEIVIFEIKSSEIKNKISSKFKQVSLLVLTVFIFSFKRAEKNHLIYS